MACTIRFANHVCDKLQGLGEVQHRKMLFGDRKVYCNGIPVLDLCGSKILVRPDPYLKEKLEGRPMEPPYSGAEPFWTLDIKDSELLRATVSMMLEARSQQGERQLVS